VQRLIRIFCFFHSPLQCRTRKLKFVLLPPVQPDPVSGAACLRRRKLTEPTSHLLPRQVRRRPSDLHDLLKVAPVRD
jgi:hypothetical protein